MLKQRLDQKLLQKLSPQQIQLMKLLQVPTMELEMRIKEEIEANPALEEGKEKEENDYDNDDSDDNTESRDEFDISDYLSDDEPAYKTSVRNKGADDDEKAIPLSGGRTFQELLIEQLGLQGFDEKEFKIGLTLIGNLDDAGYLRRDLENIIDDLAFSQNVMTTAEELESILQVIQEFDPPGTAARDLQECLLIQLRRKEKTIPVKTAEAILEDYFESFTKKHYEKIIKRLEISNDDLKEAVDEILKLNPKPGNSMKETSKSIHHVIPDFIIKEEDDELHLSLNSRNAPELKVSRQYVDMMKAYNESKSKDKQQKEALLFVKQKIDSAKWFIEAIKQRQNTLLVTMDAIMTYQRDYFLTGDETKLKPMILKDIAEIVGLDISTISRVANSKHVQTSYGTFLLKTFFSESLTNDDGEEVSTREVKKILQDAVDGEDKKKPLTDEKLANLLKEKGYNIARRTVAKYREQLNIPVARLRKEL